ncbi:hypothetical protein Bra5_PB00065 (plasmid) [Rhizobium phaseoli Brasil 5]|nr:hypothetical protein Bra5_PB00065 [Rhizobium phaseoli Brasil 5]
MPLQHTFVDEDQFLRIEVQLTIEPGAPALQDVRSVLLQCVCGLFLKVHPRPRSQAPSALRLIFTCRSTDKRSTISSSVTSLRSSINATTNSSCASTAEGRLQPCGRAVNSPSFALAIQRIAVEIPTPKRAATCRADMPDADAFKTRIRRSSLRACPIIHLFSVDVESASMDAVTSQSIHPSQDLL